MGKKIGFLFLEAHKDWTEKFGRKKNGRQKNRRKKYRQNKFYGNWPDQKENGQNLGRVRSYKAPWQRCLSSNSGSTSKESLFSSGVIGVACPFSSQCSHSTQRASPPKSSNWKLQSARIGVRFGRTEISIPASDSMFRDLSNGQVSGGFMSKMFETSCIFMICLQCLSTFHEDA